MSDVTVSPTNPENIVFGPDVPSQEIIVNNAGIKGDPGRDGADSTVPGPQGPAGSVKGYFDITDYGAIADDSTDATTAVQLAVTAAGLAGGGTIFAPSGHFVFDSSVFLPTGVSLLGQGSEATTFRMRATDKDMLISTDGASISIKGILLQGPNSGTGKGINFGWTTAGNVPFLNFIDVKIFDFGSDGVYIETPIVSSFQNVVSRGNGGWGFNWYHAGTSCTFISCWAEDNGTGGYRFFESVYMKLDGCAADGNPIGYLIDSASGIDVGGSGCERSPIGVKVTGSSAIGFHNCWNYDNQGIAYWVTGNSAGVEFYACQEAAPNASATACFQYDAGSRGMLSSPGAVTANNLSAGTVTVIDDVLGLATFPLLAVTGVADFYGASVNIHGTSGKLLLSASPDGGAYNMFVDTTGVLALYGSSTASLNMELLDGYLQLDTLTATTVPYMDANKRFVSSAVTPTELGYLSGVTSAIQTQLGLKAPLASPALTGTPTAPTATVGTNTTQLATTAFVLANAGSGMTNPMTAVGDIIYGGTAGAPTRLADVATGNVLISGGVTTAPSWGKVGISTHVSGLGTGIATALGVNTGSAGAPVLFNGAAGTPSSLTLTNATGLPIAGVTGWGTGVAAALAIAIGSAGAPVVFNGAGGTPSSLTGTNISGTAASLTAGKATVLATARTIAGVSFDGSANIAIASTNLSDTASIALLASTQTLTNKRVTPRTGTVASSATPTINTDNVDVYTITALAAAITSMTTNLSGTPTVGQQLLIGFKDNATARAITWGASFVSSGVATLLATTVISKQHWVKLMWDGTHWVCMAVDATGY